MNVAVTLSGPTKPPPPNKLQSSPQTIFFFWVFCSAPRSGSKKLSSTTSLFIYPVSQSSYPTRPRRLLPCPVRIPSDPLITDDDDSYGRVPLLRERVLITPESWNNLTAVDVVRSWAHQKFINEIIRKNILPLRRSLESM